MKYYLYESSNSGDTYIRTKTYNNNLEAMEACEKRLEDTNHLLDRWYIESDCGNHLMGYCHMFTSIIDHLKRGQKDLDTKKNSDIKFATGDRFLARLLKEQMDIDTVSYEKIPVSGSEIKRVMPTVDELKKYVKEDTWTKK